jgi:TetR/AcrR family transcriptional regulator
MANEHQHQHRMTACNRQRQLLEVALNVFSRRGFKGATTKEIAAAAGVAEAVIFQHFPSKDALYSAVLDLHLDTDEEREWVAEIYGYMDLNDDEGVCRSFVHRILHSYHSDNLIQRVILFAALEGHEQGVARLRKQFTPVFERLTAYVIQRQHEGALIDCNPSAILINLGAAAHQFGMITQIFRAPTPAIDIDEMEQAFTRILMHGIQANKKQKPAKESNRKAKK